MDKIAEDISGLAVALTDLVPLPGNPRHGHVDAIARSLEQFGQTKPVVALGSNRDPNSEYQDGTVVAGNHTLLAAQQLGWSHIAVVWYDWDDITAKAYALADNRTADLGTYDRQDLAALIEAVSVDDALLRASCYTTADLAALLGVDGAGEPAGDQSGDLTSVWSVVVSCRDEAQQLEILRRLTEEGLQCRALVS